MKISAKKAAYLALMTAGALIMFMIENLMPPLFVPGAKLGLSNIFGLLALLTLGPWEALLLVAVRTTLGSFFSGSTSALMYSLPAGLVAMLVSILLVRTLFPKISVVSVSVVAAVVHNLTQNAIFIYISDTPQMALYMPYLALVGVLSGVVVGAAVWLILRAVPAIRKISGEET